ncbi:Fic family protein [Barnesiella viscericola]|uniref:Fic family protein n=1 Tax=Barnesiella viscericola TaxID=397865 RepID=UPI0032096E91
MDILCKIKASEREAEALQQTLHEIDELSTRWDTLCATPFDPERMSPGIETTIAASLALENMPYSPSLVHKIVTDKTHSGSKTESLIQGYYAILQALYADAHKYPLCEDTIVALHTALFPNGKENSGSHATVRPAAVNFLDYKAPTLFNRSRTVSVNNEIRDLVEWTNRELARSDHHPLVIIAAFTYEFISIHPFREGKGELSRILSTLLLLQNHYEWARATSIDSLIEQQRSTYYQTLKRGQQNRYSSQENITAWVLFLCNIWLQALRSLVAGLPKPEVNPQAVPTIPVPESLAAPEAKTPPAPPVYLNSRQKRVLAVLEREEPAKVSDLAHRLQGVSINTLKKDLLYLRQHNLITAHGVLKGTIYTLKK